MSEHASRLKSAAVATALMVLALLGFALRSSELAARPADPVPAALSDVSTASAPQTAILAGGCFWGVQGVFQRVKGVRSAVSGYVGGSRAEASYDAVGTGRTRHAEAVRIVYDPAQVSYATLLRIFFSVVHDPTQKDRQENDIGPQYRSAIFPTTREQAAVATAYVRQLDGAKVFAKPIATRVETAPGFYPAEAYHQDYLTLHPNEAYIRNMDMPKIAALKRSFPSLYREQPVLVRARG
jgi:peptide-methionine (S)-S-oxide reductase